MSECLSPFIALTQYNVPRHCLQLYSCMCNLHTCDSEILTKMISLVTHPYLISIIILAFCTYSRTHAPGGGRTYSIQVSTLKSL